MAETNQINDMLSRFTVEELIELIKETRAEGSNYDAEANREGKGGMRFDEFAKRDGYYGGTLSPYFIPKYDILPETHNRNTLQNEAEQEYATYDKPMSSLASNEFLRRNQNLTGANDEIYSAPRSFDTSSIGGALKSSLDIHRMRKYRESDAYKQYQTSREGFNKTTTGQLLGSSKRGQYNPLSQAIKRQQPQKWNQKTGAYQREGV